jgi:hypothetical protein
VIGDLPESPHDKVAAGIHFARVFCKGIPIILAVCLFSGSLLAESQRVQQEDVLDYAPLFSPEQARPVQLSDCTLKTVSGYVMDTNMPTIAHCGEHDITVAGISKARKQRVDEEATHVVVYLKGQQQKTSKVVFRVSDFPSEFVDSVAFADLNGDGKDDFILNLSAHGVGLAAEFTETIYLLSTASGYRYLTLSGMNHVPRYLYFGNNPQAVLVLQRVGGPNSDSEGAWIRSLDKKPHLFFVFDLLQFDPAAPKGLKLNNRLDQRFPFWTLFTHVPRHTETSLLTPVQKKEQWDDPLRDAVTGSLVEH